MAAHIDSRIPVVLELRRLTADDLLPVLDEEVASWREQLEWDFQPSADLVRRFVQMQALNGFALVVGGETAGYSYYVSEENKGVIGDAYVRERFRSPQNETFLLAAVLDALMMTPNVHRIESQLMMLRSPLNLPLLRRAEMSLYGRSFMQAPLAGALALPQHATDREILYEQWSDRHQDGAAQVIAAAYQGHVDSQINDQYRSAGGARRFLVNIIQFPGCGHFFEPGSFVAVHTGSGRLCGISLTSLVSEKAGHITQICVLPSIKGAGVGYELLRHSMAALAEHGCHSVSLTVTSSNLTAVRLYERTGFTLRRTFSACVWDGF